MDQSSASTLAPALDESAALETLKAHLNDPAYLAFSLTGDLDAHLQRYPQTHQSLADKLDISKERPWLTQVIGLRVLSEKALAGLEVRSLTSWRMNKLMKNRPIQPIQRPLQPIQTPKITK